MRERLKPSAHDTPRLKSNKNMSERRGHRRGRPLAGNFGATEFEEELAEEKVGENVRVERTSGHEESRRKN